MASYSGAMASSQGIERGRNIAEVHDFLATVSHEVENMRNMVLNLDGKVSAEVDSRIALRGDFEDRMRRVDWENYTQELAAACAELQVWRDTIEADRSDFRNSLKDELQDTLSQRVEIVRRAVDTEVLDRQTTSAEIECRLIKNVSELMMAENEDRNRFMEQQKAETEGRLIQHLRELLEAEGDERKRVFSVLQKLDERVSKHDKLIAAGNGNQGTKTDNNQSAKTEEKLEDARELSCSSIPQDDIQMLQDRWQAAQEENKSNVDALAEEVNKLCTQVSNMSAQVEEAPQVLLELTIQLQSLQQGLATETNERNIAIDSVATKLELFSAVFNVDSKQGRAEHGEQQQSEIEKQLRLIFDQLDNLATTQLNSMREQVANCTQQLSMEVAERKSDSEQVWSSMQSLHGHLVQFISQPPPTAQLNQYMMPESQRSIGRMPRSRSPSPRMPVTLPQQIQDAQEYQPSRARPLIHLQAGSQFASSSQAGQQSVGSGQLQPMRGSNVQAYVPAAGSSRAAPQAPANVTQLAWTQQPGQEMTPGQNMSFARHLLKG